jgi:cbb3-type cytochrome oxidase maturation protein
MSIIYLLIPIAILLTSLGIYLFFWAVKTEQFDDLEKQGMSILFDEEQQVDSISTNVPVEADSPKVEETKAKQPQKTQE